LYNGAGTVKLDSTTTDVNGKYLFDSLLTGSYKVRFVAPAGTIPAKQNTGADQSDSDANAMGMSQIVNIDVTKAETDTLRNNPQIDAGFVPVGSIGDLVFNDKNANGIQEVGENGVPNVTVELWTSDSNGNPVVKLETKLTDANGLYKFSNLPKGDYVVRFTGIPSTYTGISPKDASGSNDDNDSDANPSTGITSKIVLDPAVPSQKDIINVDAGLIPVPKEVDLTLRKRVSTKTPTLGQTIIYSIVVKNQSNTDATGVEVTDLLNAGVTYQVSSADAGTYNPTTGIWTIGNLAKGDSARLDIGVTVKATGLWFNTAEITKTNERDTDSTPGNGRDGEDDIDRACFSVPIQVCPGERIVVSVPAQFTGITWYKSGVVVGQGNSYTITESGSYTYTASTGACPAGGCCPIQVIYTDCCKRDLCLPFSVNKVPARR
jgi:uncharacterized repeat protein (TIGR01451 family)